KATATRAYIGPPPWPATGVDWRFCRPEGLRPMTDKTTISAEIATIVGGNFKAWRIGLTNDPRVHKKQLRETQKQDVSRWQQWQADSLAEAKLLEGTLLKNGMQPGAGAPKVTDVFPTFVYIF